ncbi:MAG: hypothetical protein JWR48_2614, partial [Mycobacterium sp.]|nr:hypothetical protein [Mycobacterium sp.]
MPSLAEVAYLTFFGKCWRVNSFARLGLAEGIYSKCAV